MNECHSSLPRRQLVAARGVVVALVAIAVFIAGCSQPSPSTGPRPQTAATPAAQANGKVLVVAEVTSFDAQGMFDDYADGTSRVYDLTVLTVREPAALAGKTVRVMNDAPAAEGSVWRRVGSQHTFEVDREAVGNDAMTVNTAAVTLVGDVTARALQAAYRAAARERMATDGKTIVVAERRGFVVVSFLGKPSTYGGTFHVVYSPEADRDVFVYVEE